MPRRRSITCWRCCFSTTAPFRRPCKTALRSIDMTLAFLQQNIHQALTLSEMAEHAQMSKSHFSRLFREQTGYSPIDYFIHLKMQHACMLLTTRIHIREIAVQLVTTTPTTSRIRSRKSSDCRPAKYRSRHHRNTLDETAAQMR